MIYNLKQNKMKKIQCLSGCEDAQMEVLKSNMFNAAMVKINDNGRVNSVYLGKAEVQQLIDQLEELKKEIL